MSNNLNRIKTQIDFTPTRGQVDADLLFTVLMHYNKGGNTNCNSSQLLVIAYDKYDASELDEATRFIDLETRIKALFSIYDIKSKEDINEAILSARLTVNTELLLPGKKFFTFDGDDKKAIVLWDDLSIIRFRDRAAFINKFLYQYFAHGNCKYYQALCAARILEWMKNEYELMKDIGTARLEAIIDMIWRISGDKDPEKKINNEKTSKMITSSEQQLRKIIGL